MTTTTAFTTRAPALGSLPLPAPAPPSDSQRTPPAIAITGLRKSYGGREVLRGLSLDVAYGEILGILGPNGAGKTTAVEIAQGLRPRDAGSVSVLGLDPARERRRLRHLVGAQLQSSALPERMRVGEALRLFARLAGDVVDWHALEADWGLGRLSGSAFGSLSGGERQRLFIALALVSRPRVVFLDELTQALDPSARRETWRLVRRVREHGATVVLVTHDMDEAERLCDRVAVVNDGRVVASGTPAALVARHAGGVRVRFSCPEAAALEGLERVPGVHEVAHEGARAEVACDAGAAVPVVAALFARGLAPDDLAVERPSLESVFVALTQGGPS